MKKQNLFRVIILLLMVAVISISGAQAGGKITQDSALTDLSQKISNIQNRCDIIKYQWYDIYSDGLVLSADEAQKMINDANTALSAGNAQKVSSLLDRAEKLLNNYEKGNLPKYTAPAPLKDPANFGKIHPATIDDLETLKFAGVPRWNYWYNFVGIGDDGAQYMLYVCINYHGTGKVTLPVLFAMSSTKNPNEVLNLNFNMMPVRTSDKDKIIYTVNEDERSLRYTLSGGKVSIEYKDKDMSITVKSKFDYSFWYNKGLGAAMMMPNTRVAGFEQIGRAAAIFAFNDNKTVNVRGFAEQENLFCGGPKSEDYRSALLKYGNEWWVPFYSEEVSGLFCMTGRYKDAGIYYKGKYCIPSEFKVTPLEGNKSFTIDAKFAKNNLHLIVDLWGWDSKLYEHWGNCSGTVNGEELTNGYSWVEHIPQNGVNNSPPPKLNSK